MSKFRAASGALLLAWLLPTALLAQDAKEAAGTPKGLLKTLAGGKGLCVLLGQPEAGAAVALAQASGWLIYVQTPKAEDLEAARAAADAAGLLGRRIFVDRGGWARISLADNLADAVWAGADAQGAGGVAREELLRVLRPGGKAYLGTREVVKPDPKGLDDWTHPYHLGDNNPQSTDQVARAPYLTQFLAEPLFGSQPVVTVTAGGRVFKAFGHMYFKEYQKAVVNTLCAFNAYNGTPLWTRKLKAGFMLHRNTLVATPEVLYMADDESCKLLDAATGEVRGELVFPLEQAGGRVWKWMALENGVLYALLGGPELEAGVFAGQGHGGTGIGGWPWGMWPGYDFKGGEQAWGFGHTLLAVDPASKKILWRHREEERIDGRALCLKGGRLYFYCPGKGLTCLDARNGTQVWKSADAGLLGALGPDGQAQHFTTGFATSAYLKCGDGVLVFSGPQRPNLLAVSAADGKLLWQKKDGNFQTVIQRGILYAAGTTESFKLDPRTGNVLAKFTGRQNCTRATGSVDSIFFRGAGTVRWDTTTDTCQHLTPMRPDCHGGVIVSNGLLYWGPWICGCPLTLFGLDCLGPAGNLEVTAKPGDAARFESGAAPVKPLESGPLDWPAYRANPQADGVTKAKPPARPALAWEFKPPHPFQATAPVAAGGMVWLAGSDGAVRALNAADGKERWKAYTGAEIFFPPALWNGRAYVGSNDGRVYAYEAATGRPLWSFRAGPAERKIPVFGALYSTWPVAGGVVVEEGVLYAAAGIAHFDGTHVAALDALTGKVRWHNGTSGSLHATLKNGVSLSGNLSLSNGKLQFNGGNVYPEAAYDAATGRCLAQPQGVKASQRSILFPRQLWEPLTAWERAVPGGRIRLQSGAVGFVPALAGPADPAKQKAAPPAWSKGLFHEYRGIVAAGEAVLVLGGSKDSAAGGMRFSIAALNLQDGAPLWNYALPAPAAYWGLALDGQGRLFVTLDDGRVLCLADAR